MNQNIDLWLVVYDDLLVKGPRLANLVDSVLQTFQNIIVQNKLELVLQPSLKVGTSNRYWKYNDQNWNKLKEKLAHGEFEAFSIFNNSKVDCNATLDWEDSVPNPHFRFDIRNDRSFQIDSTVVSLSISRSLFDAITANWQAQLIEFAKKSFTLIEGVYGFLHNSTPSTFITEYERLYQKARVTRSAILRDQVRGVFWVNLLSSNHIQALGGLNTVTNLAPCSSVIVLDNKTRMCLQLTPSIDVVGDTQLQHLSTFFSPIMFN